MQSGKIDIKIFVILLLLTFSASSNIKAQGCSDAGFCSLHSLKPEEKSETMHHNHITAGISYGKGENGISIVSPYLQFTRNINTCLSFSGKILFSSVKGDLGNVNGISDAFISSNYSVGNQTGLTLGLKIPFNDGNIMNNNIPLPMAYQTSLGTLDIIAGLNHSHENFEFMTAIQQPLTQNKNQFFTGFYPPGSEAQKYQSTNNYKRSGDILFRVSYTFIINNGQFKIKPGLLPIYHLSNDKFTDGAGVEQSIEGSQGFTINGNLFLVYSIDRKNTIEIGFGTPMKSRTARPDGLTRKFAASLEYKVSF